MAIRERGVYFQNEFKRCNFKSNQIIVAYLFAYFVFVVETVFQLQTYPLFLKVAPGKNNSSTEKFRKFKSVLETMVTNAEKNRIMQHLRYIFISVAILFITNLLSFLCLIEYSMHLYIYSVRCKTLE